MYRKSISKSKLYRNLLLICIGLFGLIILMGTCNGPAYSIKSPNTYRVQVRVSLGNCKTVETILVEANSSSSAQRMAERLVKYKTQTSIKSCTQVK